MPEFEELPCQNCKVDTQFRFVPPCTPRGYREILNALSLKDSDIAKAFGYKNLGAFTISTASRRIKAGVEFIFYAALYKRGRGTADVRRLGGMKGSAAIFASRPIPGREAETFEVDGTFVYLQPEWRQVYDEFDFYTYFK